MAHSCVLGSFGGVRCVGPLWYCGGASLNVCREGDAELLLL